MRDAWDINIVNLEERARKARSERKWQRYMSCEWPDPALLPEINTYINLWREDLSSNTVDVVLNDSKKCLNVCIIILNQPKSKNEKKRKFHIQFL